MKYLCLVYTDATRFNALSASEHEDLTTESLDHDDGLKASGHFIAANALQSTAAAVTVHVRDGKMSSTDGPFAETKEHLGGYILIEARDLNEAIRIAAKIPMARYGSIEVRPILELSRKPG